LAKQRPAPDSDARERAEERDVTPQDAHKLSYKDERELAALPQAIEALELEQAEVTARMSLPGLHRGGPERLRGAGSACRRSKRCCRRNLRAGKHWKAGAPLPMKKTKALRPTRALRNDSGARRQ